MCLYNSDYNCELNEEDELLEGGALGSGVGKSFLTNSLFSYSAGEDLKAVPAAQHGAAYEGLVL